MLEHERAPLRAESQAQRGKTRGDGRRRVGGGWGGRQGRRWEKGEQDGGGDGEEVGRRVRGGRGGR